MEQHRWKGWVGGGRWRDGSGDTGRENVPDSHGVYYRVKLSRSNAMGSVTDKTSKGDTNSVSGYLLSSGFWNNCSGG